MFQANVPVIATREKISTDDYMGGVYFAWKNWRKPLAEGRRKRHRYAKSWMRKSVSPSYVMIHSTRFASVTLFLSKYFMYWFGAGASLRPTYTWF